MYRSDLLRLGLCTGASILAIAPFLATSVHAFPGGGFSHGGGGGISGGGFSRGISGGIPGGFSHGIGGAAPMIRSWISRRRRSRRLGADCGVADVKGTLPLLWQWDRAPGPQELEEK